MQVNIPGVAWVALITALSTWLTQYVDAPWVAGAVVGLGALAKLLQVYAQGEEQGGGPVYIDDDQTDGAVPPAMPAAAPLFPRKRPGKLTRFLVG